MMARLRFKRGKLRSVEDMQQRWIDQACSSWKDGRDVFGTIGGKSLPSYLVALRIEVSFHFNNNVVVASSSWQPQRTVRSPAGDLAGQDAVGKSCAQP